MNVVNYVDPYFAIWALSLTGYYCLSVLIDKRRARAAVKAIERASKALAIAEANLKREAKKTKNRAVTHGMVVKEDKSSLRKGWNFK